MSHIVAWYVDRTCEYRVRFDGLPYSQWEIGDDTPMIRLHSLLETVNISDFQNGLPQTLTLWNKEWDAVKTLVFNAINCIEE